MYYKDKSFGFFDYEQLTKDLCYNKPLSFYFQTHNSHSRFQFSNLVQFRSGKCMFADNTKIVHKFTQNHMLITNFALNNMRIYYGYQLPNSQPHHHPQSTIIYSRIRSDRKLQNASFTLGAQRKTASLQFDTNLSIFLSERNNDYYLYSKFLYLNKHFNMGLLSIFDFGCRNLQTNNVVLELKPHEKHQIFVRGEVDGLRNYSLKYSKIGNYFDYFTLNYIMKPTETLALMAQVKYDVNSNKIKNVQSIIEKRFAHNKVKFGLNQLADIIFQIQFPLSVNKASNFDFGIELSDILKSRKISYGVKINLNL